MLTKGAIGNLINRYRAVLKKCHLINTFGSLAVASMLVLGGTGVAGATLLTDTLTTNNYTLNSSGIWEGGQLTTGINGTFTVEDSLYVKTSAETWINNPGGTTTIELADGKSFTLHSTAGSSEVNGVLGLNHGFVTISGGDSVTVQSDAVTPALGYYSDSSISSKNITLSSKSIYAIYTNNSTHELNATGDINISSEAKNAIYVSVNEGKKGKVAISDFTNLSVKSTGDGAGVFNQGGDIEMTGINVTLESGQRAALASYSVPGTTIIDASGNVTLSATISDNSYGDTDDYKKSALYNDAGTITVTADGKLTIEDKSSRAQKSAIHTKGGTTTLEGGADSKITGNLNIAGGTTTITLGGGSKIEGYTSVAAGAELSITGASISGQSVAVGDGGAVYNKGTMSITDSTFSANSARREGGAIKNEGSLTITDSTFTGNAAEYVCPDKPFSGKLSNIKTHGGAISNTGTLTITGDTEFSENKSELTYYKKFLTTYRETKEGFGGAIDSDGKITITGSAISGDAENGFTGGVLFKDNSSYSAGAIYLGGTGYGTSDADENYATFENVRFEKNTAGGGGGGALKICAEGKISFQNTIFKENTSGDKGGAIYVHSDSGTYKPIISISDSQFIKNTGGNGAIHNESTINFSGINTFTGNKSGSVAQDIHNTGTINVAGGTTTIGGGISGGGTTNIAAGATLALDADKDGGVVTIDNVVSNAGDITVADAAVINKTIESKDGVITLADGAKLTVNADKSSGAILGDVTITGNGDVTLTGKKFVLSSTTGWNYDENEAKAGAVDVDITAKSLTIESAGTGIQNIAGKHTITADTVSITANNGGHGIQIHSQPKAEVAVNFGDGGLTITKKDAADDDGHAIYVLDHGYNSSSVLNINAKEGTKGNIAITGDERAAVAVLGTKADASISGNGNVTISSNNSSSTSTRKSAVVYVTGGKLDISADEKLTIEDKLVDDVNNAIGIAVGGEVTLDGKNVDIIGDIASIEPDASEDDYENKKVSYGSDADQQADGKWLDYHNGKLTITVDEAIKVTGGADFYGELTATAGTDITIGSVPGKGLQGSGKYDLTAGGDVNIIGEAYGFHGDGGKLAVKADGDVNITGATKTALYFAPSVAEYVDPVEAQKNLTVSILSTQGDVNIKTTGTDAHGISTRGPLSITAEKGDISILGKGRTALANWFDNYKGNIGASTTTINATAGDVVIKSDIAEANTGNHYKEAALYTQAGTTEITAGGDIIVADTGARANKLAISVADGGSLSLDATGKADITGNINVKGADSHLGITGGAGSKIDGRVDIAQNASASLTGDINFTGQNNVGNGNANSLINNSGTLVVDGASFVDNGKTYADSTYHVYGTVIAQTAGASATIKNSTFDGNILTGSSGSNRYAQGAIYNDGGSLNVSNSVFKNNEATATKGYAAAIYHIGTGSTEAVPSLVVEGSTFANNSANWMGGAIYVSTANAEFKGNHFGTYKDEQGKEFAGNSCDSSSVMVLNTASATFEDNTFVGNTHGKEGAIAILNSNDLSKKSVVTFKGSNLFEGNNATNASNGDGGALHIHKDWNLDGNLTVSIEGNAVFKENSAAKDGGAIYNLNKLSIAGATFDTNTAGGKGGAIYNAGDLTFSGENSFTGNTDSTGANDIYNAGTITVADGETTIGGGISGEGKINITNGTLKLDSDSNAPVSVEHTVAFEKGATLNVVDSALIDGSVEQVQGSVITLNDKAELTIKSNGKRIFNVQGGEDSKLTLEARTEGSFGTYANNGLGMTYGASGLNQTVDINVGELIIKNAYEGAESPSTAIQSDGNTVTLTADKMTIEGYGAGLKTDGGSKVTLTAAESLTMSGTKSSGIRADTSATVTLKGDADGSEITVTGGQYGAIRITGTSEVIFDNAAGTNKVSYTNTAVPYASINVANANSKLNMIGTNIIEGDLKVTGSAAFTGETSIDGNITGAGNVTLNDGSMTLTGTVDSFLGSYTQKAGSTTLVEDNKYFGGAVEIEGGELVADYDMMMDADRVDALITDEQVSNLNVSGGSLNLDLMQDDGVTFGTYTRTDLANAKLALFDGDAGQLNIINANLVIDDDRESIILGHVGGTIADGSKIAIAIEGQTYAEAEMLGASVVDKMVTIVAARDENPAFNSEKELSLAADITAKGLNVGDAEKLTLTDGATVAFAATNADGLFVNANGAAVALDVDVNKGASLTLGVAGQEGDRTALFDELNNAGSFTATDTAIDAGSIASTGETTITGGSVDTGTFTVSGGTTTLSGIDGDIDSDIDSFIAEAGDAIISGVKGVLGTLGITGEEATVKLSGSDAGAATVAAGKLNLLADSTVDSIEMTGSKAEAALTDSDVTKDVAVKAGSFSAENSTVGGKLGVSEGAIAELTGTDLGALESAGTVTMNGGKVNGDATVSGGFASITDAELAALKATGGETGLSKTTVASIEMSGEKTEVSLDGASKVTGKTTVAAGKLTAAGAALADLAVSGGTATLTNGSAVAALGITGGSVTLDNSTLNDADVTVSKGSLTLKQATASALKALTVADKASVSVEATDLALDTLTVNSGTMNITDAEKVAITTMKANGGESTITNSGVTISDLIIDGGDVSIIDSELVTIEHLTANKGTLFADPSTVIINDLPGDNKLGTATVIGTGTAMVIGGTSLKGAVAGAGDYLEKEMPADTAALILGEHIDLGTTGSLLVKPGAAIGDALPGGNATFAEGSFLAADGHDAHIDEKNAIISGGGAGSKLSVLGKSTLYLANVAANSTYVIADNFGSYDVSDSAWSQDAGTLILNGLLDSDLKAVTNDDGTVQIVTSTKVDEDSAFFDAIPTNALHELAEVGGAVESADMGKQFLSRAVDPTYMDKEAEAIATINEVSRAAVTAGVQNTSLRIADAASNTVVDHMSLAQHDGSKAIHSNGADFWAAPMYGNLYASGMNVAGSSVRGQFGGLALGVDTEGGQFLGGNMRFGAAINGGGGQSETKGTATSTKNDYDFGGLNLYAGWNKGALNVIGSVGYGYGNHDVEMGMAPGMKMSSAKADIDTTVFTADLRAEYQLKTNWLDVLPHAGIRYTALRTDAHDLKVGGSVLNSVASDTQNIVQFPIGVTLSKDFDFSGWNVKPMADISVIPAAGEKKAFTKMNFSGMDAWDSVNSRIMDSTSWSGTIGVQAEKGNFSLGLNYGVQASSNETDQNIQLKLGWKF